MDIYLTPVSGSMIQFPMLPEQITMGADAKFMTYSIISLGDVKIPRGQGTKEISWSGKFPGKPRKGSILIRKFSKPDTLVKKLEKYRDKGTQCTLLVTDTCINYSVYVSSFKGKYTGGSGDFDYDIKFVIAREIKIYTTKELGISTTSTNTRTSSSETESATQKSTTTYTVKSGDSLWRIAQKYLGDGSRYTEIYNLNKDKISDPNLIYPGQVFTLPSS